MSVRNEEDILNKVVEKKEEQTQESVCVNSVESGERVPIYYCV